MNKHVPLHISNTMQKQAVVLLLGICVTAIASIPLPEERIIGGSVTNIYAYPFAAILLATQNNIHFRQSCGGTIINNRSVLSAAHCWFRLPVANSYRIRVGSTNANSGGLLYHAARVIGHPQYNTRNNNNDVGVVRVVGAFEFERTVRVGALAGGSLIIPDNAYVTALGWGFTTPTGISSEELRHVQIHTINQERCQNLYGGGTNTITVNMLCAGWDAGGRGSCFGDSGTGLVYRNVIVGVTSFGRECASPRWPGVYARVSRFITWIENNA